MAELEIERDDRVVAMERRVHRIAVVVMTLVVLSGALGVFGFGPLASATRQGAGFTVTYERFARNGAQLRLTVDQTRPGAMRVWIDDTLLEAFLALGAGYQEPPGLSSMCRVHEVESARGPGSA